MTKWNEVINDESKIDSTTETIDLQDDGTSNQRIRFSIPTLGQSVIPIHKLSDLPPLLNGFRQLEQDKVYLFVEEISSPDTLLVPAGWNGYIVGMHNPLTKFVYTGTGAALETLDISGLITLIEFVVGGSRVNTFTPHGLLDGQFINITGTTSYNQQGLVISNVTSTTFDIQIPFSFSEAGTFDTGYNAINIMNMNFTNTDTADWLNIQAANTSSIFRYNNIKAQGFSNLGSLLGGRIIGYDGNFDFIDNGLSITDIDKADISTTTISNLGTSVGSVSLAVAGSTTRDIILDKMQFNVNLASQFPIRIAPSITNADLISITNSPDNNIATDYFDTTSGGLDQTDAQVFTFNNGVRADSTTESESRSTGILEVDGSGGVAVPIEDITPASGDFELDSASAGFSIDTSTGVVTYNGQAQISVLIGYNLEAAQTSGPNQNLTFDLRINNTQQTKTIKTLITMGVGDFLSVANIGGLFIINPNDTFKLFKNNISNTNNTNIQNTILLIR